MNTFLEVIADTIGATSAQAVVTELDLAGYAIVNKAALTAKLDLNLGAPADWRIHPLVSEKHCFYAGFVTGLAWREGVQFSVTFHEGRPTADLMLTNENGDQMRFVIPEPPADWSLE